MPSPFARGLAGDLAGEDDQLSLEFDRAALLRGEIEYDGGDRVLTIKQVPDELAARLRQELPGDG